MPKIVILAANPKNTSRLRLDEELRDIEEGLRRASHRDRFTLTQRLAVRPRDIHRAMLEETPQIVHFSGHGDGEEGLVFEDETGRAQVVSGKALAELFELFADPAEFPDPIYCVVLNGCYSQVQTEAIADHVPYVVGMTKAIGDRAAIEFAVGFYDALGAGRSVEFAFKLGCAAISLAGKPESATPILLHKHPSPDPPPSSPSPPSPSPAIPQDRTELYQLLLTLPGPQFETLLFDLKPPKGNISPATAPQGQRVPELFAWLESIGPGLEALRATLENVLNPFSGEQAGGALGNTPPANPTTAMQVSGNRTMGHQQWLDQYREMVQQTLSRTLYPSEFDQGCLDTARRLWEIPLEKALQIETSVRDEYYGSIESAAGVDYQLLRVLLYQHDWQAADHETELAIFKAVNQDMQPVTAATLHRLPSVDLATIDALWSRSSAGRFGFKAQQQVYRHLEQIQPDETRQWRQFQIEVGWREEPTGSYCGVKLYTELNFSLQAPPGHLPTWRWCCPSLESGYEISESVAEALFLHMEKCLSIPGKIFPDDESDAPARNLLEDADHHRLSPGVAAVVYFGEGDAAKSIDANDKALGNYEQAIGLFRAVGDRLGEANTLKAIGDVLQFLDRRDEALGNYEQAIGLFRAVGSRLGEANTLKAIGDVLQFLDRRDEALGNYEQAIGLFRAVGDRLGEANTLQGLGNLKENADEALELYREAHQLYRQIGAQYSQARNLRWFIAEAQIMLGQVVDARTSLQEAADIFDSIGLEDYRDGALGKIEELQ